MKMSYIPKESFESLLSLELDLKYKSKILSDLCRINIMYMINSAGSGHLGSSFSSVDIISWIMSEYVTKNTKVYGALIIVFCSQYLLKSRRNLKIYKYRMFMKYDCILLAKQCI